MRRSRHAWLAGGLLVSLLVLSAQAVDAHSGRRPDPRPTASSAPADVGTPAPVAAAALTPPARKPPVLVSGSSTSLSPWLAAAAVFGLAGVAARRSRRLTVWALALVLTVFVAESAIHSVHHVSDPRGAAHCQVLPVAQHLTGHVPTSGPVVSEPADAGPLLLLLAKSFHSDLALRPDLGRAPPVSA